MLESSVWRSVFQKLLFNETVVNSPEGVLRILGFVHLYTASGIHIYALMSFLERIANHSKLPKWLLRSVGYAWVIYLWKLQAFRLGFARPLFTFFIRSYAKEKGLKWRVLYPLAITFLIDLLFRIEAGRLHYYLAVGGGLITLDYLKQHLKNESLWLEHLGLALGAWIFIAMHDFYFWHQVAWMTPFYSLCTLPVISLFLYPLSALAILFTPNHLEWCFVFWENFIQLILYPASQGFTFSWVSFPSIILGGIFAFALVIGLYFFREKRPRSLIFMTLFMLVCLIRVADPVLFKDEKLVQIDVKQGDSLLVQLHGRTEMIDVGSKRAMTPSSWLLEFSKLGVSNLDCVLLTHLDEDHVGALAEISNLVKIECVETHESHWRSEKGLRLRQRLHDVSSETRVLHSGGMELADVSWFGSTEHHSAGNELMAGSIIELNDHLAYFALGDGDRSQEKDFEKRFALSLASHPQRIWKLSHHGSRFSSDPEFLKNLSPVSVWISVGMKNSYHHPHPTVLSLLQELGLKVHRTDQEGDIFYRLNWHWVDLQLNF